MKTLSMEAFGILLMVSLAFVGISAGDDDPRIAFANPRFKRQQNGFTLGQQVQTLQNQNGQQSGQQPSDFWQTGNANNGNSQTQSQNTNTNNQGSTTTTDAETQRINDCIQRNCRQGVQLASLCGTDNVSYKNRPYFNCVRDCGRRIDIQHYGDCYTTRGAPNALSTG